MSEATLPRLRRSERRPLGATIFQPLILFGMALDVAVIVALVWLKWPSESMVGA